MNKDDLRILLSILEYKNEKVIFHHKNKLRELISKNEDEFFECVSKEPKNFLTKNHQTKDSWQEHFVIHIDLSDIDPSWVVEIVYKFQSFTTPPCLIVVFSDQLQHFSKFEELKSLCESISYFGQASFELEKFLKEEGQKYTLSRLLRTYPELHEFTKKRFRFRFALGPYKDPKKLKALPEHLGDYIRKVQFMEKALFD
jgi:hypothetical protein